MMKIILFWCLYVHIVTNTRCENEVSDKKVKGQKFVHETMSAKVVGGEIPKQVISALMDENYKPYLTETDEQDLNSVPKLLAENVKTTITRYTVPLTTSEMDNEWYRTTLKKFLIHNHINLVDTNEYNNRTEVNVELLQEKLAVAIKFRYHTLQILENLLFNHFPMLNAYYNSLLFIYNEIVQNKIHIFDILEFGQINNIPVQPIKDQLLHVFELFERFGPGYLKSCVTFWLQGIHEEESINFANWMGRENELDLLSQLNISTALAQYMTFPKEVTYKTRHADVKFLGKMIAHTITSINLGLVPLKANIVGNIFLLLPQKYQNAEATQYAQLFANRINIEEKRFCNNVTNNQINKTWDIILDNAAKCLTNAMDDGTKIHVIMSSLLQPAESEFVFKNKSSFESLLSIITLQDFGVEIYKIKNKIHKYFSESNLTISNVNENLYDNPLQNLMSTLTYMQITLSDLPTEIKDELEILNMHLYFHLIVRPKSTISSYDLSRILLSYDTSAYHDYIRSSVKVLIDELSNGCMKSNFTPVSQEQCVQPRPCFRAILSDLQKQLKKSNKKLECQKAIRDFLYGLNEYNIVRQN